MVVEKLFYWPDIHFPYQDDEVITSAFYFQKDFEPDHVVQGGDLIDCYALSSYSKDPDRLLSFQEEVEQGENFWANVKKISPKAKRYMKQGNHEERLQKVLNSKPELSPLKVLKLEYLLGLDKHEVKYFKSHQRMIFHKVLECTHGHFVRARAGYTAQAEVEKRMMNGISGHTHRAAKVNMSRNGNDYCWVESGYLGNPNSGFEFMGDVPPDWKKAVTVAYMYHNGDEDWKVKLELVEADKHNNFFYNGKLYTPKGVLTF